MKQGLRTFLTVLLPVVYSTTAWAHSLWLEPAPEGKLMLRFGEYQNNLREPSGKMQRLGSVRGQLQNDAAPREISLTTEADGFAYSKIQSGDSALFRAENVPVRDPKEGQTATRSLWFGRWIPSSWKSLKPVLPLDMVPVSPKKLLVTSKSLPLPETTIQFLSSTGEKGELVSDAKGLLDLKNLKPGFYLLTAQTKEKQPGTLDGKSYENVSTRMTLSFRLL